jgi:hypothetical protein
MVSAPVPSPPSRPAASTAWKQFTLLSVLGGGLLVKIWMDGTLMRGRRPKPRQQPPRPQAAARPQRRRSGPRAKSRTRHSTPSPSTSRRTTVSSRRSRHSASSRSPSSSNVSASMARSLVSPSATWRRRAPSSGSYTTTGNLSTVRLAIVQSTGLSLTRTLTRSPLYDELGIDFLQSICIRPCHAPTLYAHVFQPTRPFRKYVMIIDGVCCVILVHKSLYVCAERSTPRSTVFPNFNPTSRCWYEMYGIASTLAFGYNRRPSGSSPLLSISLSLLNLPSCHVYSILITGPHLPSLYATASGPLCSRGKSCTWPQASSAPLLLQLGTRPSQVVSFPP